MSPLTRTLSLIALGLIALYGVYRAGGNAREAKITAHVADSVAKVATARVDSVRLAGLAKQDSAQRLHDATNAAALARLNAEKRRTNAANQAGAAAIETARAILSDSAATIDTLRASLTRTVQELASVMVAGARERAAADSVIQAERATRARERLLYAQRDSATRHATAEAFAALNQRTDAAVAKAYRDGKKRARTEDAAAAALAALVKWVLDG